MKFNQTFSILIWINRNRTKNGEANIYARITIDGKRAEISLQRSIKPESWDVAGGKAKGNTEAARTLNSFIELAKSNLYKIYNHLIAQEKEVTAEKLKNAFNGVTEERKTLMQAFDYHNTKFKELVDKEKRSPYVLKMFERTKSTCTELLKKQYKVSDISLSELKYSFITELEHYLITVKDVENNTAMNYIKKLKKVVSIACKNDWVKSNPFAEFKCSFEESERGHLTETELEIIIRKKMPIARLEEVKDAFLFSCYTGFGFSEVQKLTHEDMNIGMDGEFWISTKRIKTDSRESVPVLSQTLEIIEKYKKHPKCLVGNTLVPVNSNARYNAYLKEIADLCGIKKNLTTHMARHTFATTVTLSNGVSIESVSSMLGHKSIRTTQIYAKVVQKKVSEDMNKLREKLNKNKDETSIKLRMGS